MKIIRANYNFVDVYRTVKAFRNLLVKILNLLFPGQSPKAAVTKVEMMLL